MRLKLLLIFFLLISIIVVLIVSLQLRKIQNIVINQTKTINGLNSQNMKLSMKLNDFNTNDDLPPFYRNQNLSCQDWVDEPPVWKTYTNNKYRFILTLPGKGVQYIDKKIVECSIGKINLYDDNQRPMYIYYYPQYYLSVGILSDESESIYRDLDKLTSEQLKTVVYPKVGADEAYASSINNQSVAGTYFYAKYKKGNIVIYITWIQNGASKYDCQPISEFDFSKCEKNPSKWECSIDEKTRQELSIYNNWKKATSIRFF